MTKKYFDFNDAEDNKTFFLIPKGILAKVKMTITPGWYIDQERGWTDGFATRSETSGSIYLNVTFLVMQGQFTRRQMLGRIGLHSEKGDTWGKMGRSFIKEILNSANGLKTSDVSERAQHLRKINDFGDLNNIEFLALIDIKREQDGTERNVINHAVTADHKDYIAYMERPELITTQSNKPKDPEWK